MARTREPQLPEAAEETIVDIDVASEMETSYLEYAYSVIYARALPDARDGLKPVQRRILFQMVQMGLSPDRPHVKSARVVGDVMGRLHPHGDGAIYDAMVRMAQAFSLRLPLVDGHGNFGSLDDGPAAYRYTEARLAPAALALTADLSEDVVDFVPNYDSQLTQPAVLPAAFPNLLVNGASGIAVGMATNMAPHNLVEVVAAARHLIDHPDADLDALMRFVPGPDLPGGGTIVGLDGIREAYQTGRGVFRTRAKTRVENVTARRKGIVVTELPYLVGPEKVIEKIKDAVRLRGLQGIAAVTDLTDRVKGLHLLIEVKNGFNPEAVLGELYRLTPMEDSFGINNVALVDGQPRTMGLRELLQVYVDHRLEVVRRRSEYRLARRLERLHLVEGLLIAILDIDEVIQVIRASDDAPAARGRLIQVFDLTEVQAEYILELRLRRLTRFSRIELEAERDALTGQIAQLRQLLDSPHELRGLVSSELAEVSSRYGTPRRTVLLAASGTVGAVPAAPLEVLDGPCWVLLSTTGLLARTAGPDRPGRVGERSAHDAIVGVIAATVRGEVAAVTSRGRALRLPCLDLPALPDTQTPPSLAGGVPASDLFALDGDEHVIAVMSLDPAAGPLALGTASGVVKRVAHDVPRGEEWELIALRPEDRVIGAAHAPDPATLVFVTTDAQLLRFAADAVRPQGRQAGGMAGIKLSASAQVLFFGVVGGGVLTSAPTPVPAADGAEPDTLFDALSLAGRDADPPEGTAAPTLPGESADDAVVVTIAGSSRMLTGTQAGAVKVTPFNLYPAKGRATGGVRCQRFLRGQNTLLLAWVGPAPARGVGAGGQPLSLPAPDLRRDGSGSPQATAVASIG
ncbi:MAG: DNA topoisomerase IV subunit A [Bifidobacteriaceae bacterium]|jgi:DNA gyrase subunit A|nr:DNA topoisomerase IV subunit A [Bifidobacteriaceae bacterium]